jgi:hypothetical protein
MCNICNKNKAEETHHIIYQHTADKNGFINNTFHKNAKHNLVAICKECHRKEHSGKIKIECWISSSKGRKLICNYNYDNTNNIPDTNNTSDTNEIKDTDNNTDENDSDGSL